MANLNLETIPKKDFPLLVFTDNTSGFLEWLIKWRTKGHYNHVMWAHEKGKFASQGNTYSEVPYSRYMKPRSRMKFVSVAFESPAQRYLVIASINKKLRLPWYRKMYDRIGVFGQAIGIKWISTPGLDYCSEDAPRHLKYLSKYLNEGFLKTAIDEIPPHTSPEDFNKHIKCFQKVFSEYGRWDSDAET